MTNYYDILGVQANAGITDIKTAFRKLAKQYHPDKNPHGKERFEQVLKAYETLSDPKLKSAYDHKLRYSLYQPEKTTAKKNTKTWRFDEKELKRRQYYDEHIRKHAKNTASYNATVEEKKTYNEFKYILFATPLAVALFLLIMRLANPEPPRLKTSHKKNTGVQISSTSDSDNGYSSYFGEPIFNSTWDRQLKLQNPGQEVAIVCIFTASRFLRCIELAPESEKQVKQLPQETLFIRFTSGENYDPSGKTDSLKIDGAFSKQSYFYKKIEPGQDVKQLQLETGPGSGFNRITETAFFKKI